MDQLSDSREVMDQKVPKGISIFIIFLTTMLFASLIWSYFCKMDIYVEALGEVRTDHVLGTVTLLEGGKVKEIFFHDGDEVKEGETLFSLDGHQYQNQINAITAQIENKRQEIIDYETLKNAILQDKNLFNEAEKPFFYYQYEDYHIELQRALLYLKSDYSRDLTILNIKNTHYLNTLSKVNYTGSNFINQNDGLNLINFIFNKDIAIDNSFTIHIKNMISNRNIIG
jgi:multidrug resistance efflux pump